MFLKNAWLFVLEATGDISCKPDHCSSHDAAWMLDGAAPPSEAPVPESMTTVRTPHPFFFIFIFFNIHQEGPTMKRSILRSILLINS